MDTSVAPLNVSPLIKTARWGLLVAGVFYGAMRHKMLSRKEKLKRDELERTRPEREAKLKAEREQKLKEEMNELTKNLGTQF